MPRHRKTGLREAPSCDSQRKVIVPHVTNQLVEKKVHGTPRHGNMVQGVKKKSGTCYRESKLRIILTLFMFIAPVSISVRGRIRPIERELCPFSVSSGWPPRRDLRALRLLFFKKRIKNLKKSRQVDSKTKWTEGKGFRVRQKTSVSMPKVKRPITRTSRKVCWCTLEEMRYAMRRCCKWNGRKFRLTSGHVHVEENVYERRWKYGNLWQWSH